MTRGERLLEAARIRLMAEHRVTLDAARPEQLHGALAGALIEDIAPAWARAEEKHDAGRQVAYLSAEYLIGRQIFNNLYCAGLLGEVEPLLAAQGASLAALEDIEDAALGNGGLGRLAACYLDSAATHGVPLTGYGLRYRYGLFRQSFEEGRQVESPDDWTRWGDPWGVRREALGVVVELKEGAVRAVPYDMPVLGFGTDNIGTLRLWQTEAIEGLDFQAFADQRYAQASLRQRRAEDIVRVLYPNDTRRAGKLMRVKQQYVLSSASLKDMLRAFRARFGGDYEKFPERYAIQLNDTHPAMAIPELIRLLMADGVSFDDAFALSRRTFSYTNHTVMAEALEVWDERLLAGAVPQLAGVIRRIDAHLSARHPGRHIVLGGKVHMADLSVYATCATNGVARIHSDILKRDLFADWHALYPERFFNVTNGITQRRWLGLCNPELTRLLKDRLGTDGFLTDLNRLSELKGMIDEALCDEFLGVKREKKCQLSSFIERREGVEIPTDFIFDVQVKRLHEYKRQLMNALALLAIYFELKAGNLQDFRPMAAIFGAKAYPGYTRAKAVIHLIHRIAALVNSDERTNDRLRVVFVSDYNVSYAERIIPAAEISEQISPAGTEASGTGNMKLMLNGAITLGTMDGANVEIVEQAGIANAAIFGATVEELNAMKANYQPRQLYDADELLRRCVDALADGTLGERDAAIAELKDALLAGTDWHAPDHYFVLHDFHPYLEARLNLNRVFADPRVYARMALHNIASAGHFSADRAVKTYAREIWRV
ncbi:MAG: glycogen/starch/alpha-glucan phosphorylase [Christensenellaceae bacterium]|nr:glycogen/starch/alpha-glucan phosphorylase [Christensenellaceae bacterium]